MSKEKATNHPIQSVVQPRLRDDDFSEAEMKLFGTHTGRTFHKYSNLVDIPKPLNGSDEARAALIEKLQEDRKKALAVGDTARAQILKNHIFTLSYAVGRRPFPPRNC